MSTHSADRSGRGRRRARLLTAGMAIVLAGCAPGTGGCAPTDAGGGTTTTVDGTTTTVDPDGSTTTIPDGSTTTVPDGSTTSTTVPDGSTTTTVPGEPGPTVRVDTLDVEDCFSPADADTLVDRVRVIECDEPHQMEVFAQYELDEATEYPGGSELTFAAQDECQSRFEAYVGHSYWSSELDLTTLTPSFSTWDVGDRTVTCLLVAGDCSMLAFAARNASR